MQIPQKFNQFEGNPTLIIVTGSQFARFYYAVDGAIEEITKFKIPTPTYHDREGFFLRSGKGTTYGRGAVYESKQKSTDDQFTERLNELLNAIRKEIDIENVILCSPDYEAPIIKTKLPPSLKKKEVSEIHGNYTKLHPTKLLEKLS